MEYTEDFHVESLVDVMNFFHYMVYEEHINVHPDIPIEYCCDVCVVTEEKVGLYNRMMEESIGVCAREGADIYHIGCDVLHGYLEELRKG